MKEIKDCVLVLMQFRFLSGATTERVLGYKWSNDGKV